MASRIDPLRHRPGSTRDDGRNFHRMDRALARTQESAAPPLLDEQCAAGGECGMGEQERQFAGGC
jgi:hypothetical protein